MASWGDLCSGHGHRLKRYGSPTGKPAPKVLGVCAVEGCGGKLAGAGYCRKHYKRFRAHGDPLGGGIDYGSANEFVVDSAKSEEKIKCIIWPFGKSKDGYGRVNIGGTPKGAHVAVAELAHGPKPTAKHECCHSCGNGHLGCVNPAHMYWGTRKENVADAIAHGTSYTLHVPIGEAHHCAKYDDAIIDIAMRRIQSGERPSSVARSLGISASYIYSLSSGKSKRAQAWLAANDNVANERRVA
jgi:HNH endonuclease